MVLGYGIICSIIHHVLHLNIENPLLLLTYSYATVLHQLPFYAIRPPLYRSAPIRGLPQRPTLIILRRSIPPCAGST
jgi:hypothetical protein